MSVAKCCDVCGDFYRHYGDKDADGNVQPNAISLVYVSKLEVTSKNFGVIDCCPKCLESIKNHMDVLKCFD